MRWMVLLVRLLGAACAVAALAGTPYVVAKLYTGRHADTPIAAAIAEQPLVVFLGLCAFMAGFSLVVWAPAVVSGWRWINPVWVLRHRRAEAALLVVSIVLAGGVLEIASRLLYARQYNFPFRHDVEELIYPPLREQLQQQPYSADAVNVLLLGGSVMWFAGNQHQIEAAFDPPARVYNLAQNAHSSLDSLNKYEWMARRGYKFDYVIFYHGINEVRANNAPPEVFKSDYDHYSFYQLTNTVFQGKRPWLGAMLRSSLFFRCYRLWETLRETRLMGRHLLHIAFPREDWLQYAAEPRSTSSFRANLEQISRLAKAQGATLIVPKFAYNPMIDDKQHEATPTEWGLAGHVAKGIRAHNDVIESMRDQFVAVDETQRLMVESNFIDPCHFTEEAQREFLDILKKSLRDAESLDVAR